jgi:ubiquinone/menaquinone biosynthesis C-methylase UbiE
MTTYIFDAQWKRERARLRSLEALFDRASARYLAELGVAAGWRCLEVGCGAGGIALWLADRVGRTGRVVATDLDTHFIDGRGQPNLDVRKHNIMIDPIDEGSFDLAHARAVVEHIPNHEQALNRMISAVRPGGWVLVEDVDFGGVMAAALARYFLPAEHRPLVERVYRAVEAAFSAAGADPCFGTRLVDMFSRAGLHNIGAELHTPVVAGGSEDWARGTVEQLAPRLVETGLLTQSDAGSFLRLAGDAASYYTPPLMISAWGQRPMSSV